MGDETRYRNTHNVKPSLEEVFNHYGGELPDYRQGHGLKVKCPWHGDTEPSAVYNEDWQTFHCFACDMRGDSWQLIMDSEGVDFPGAMRFAVEQDWLQVADDGVTLTGGHESETQAPRRRGRRRRVRKLRRKKRR